MDIAKNTKIYIAGHRGMVGSTVWRELEKRGYQNLLGRTSTELDLKQQTDVQQFFREEQPDVVIDAAARVGGIMANDQYPYTFLMNNLQIQNNLIDAAHQYKAKKFIFLGSSCIYPKHAPQPLKEDYLLTGPLEPTNQWYAIAKIAGVKACEALRKQYDKDFVSLMPTNLYGERDNFDLETSHVLPAMIRKFHDAKENNDPFVELWGTGSPRREFLHVADLANAVCFCLEQQLDESLYNVGTGTDITIKELANIIQEIVGFEGNINWDTGKPDGTPRKLLDVSRLEHLGWKAETGLKTGIKKTYEWFLNHSEDFRTVKL